MKTTVETTTPEADETRAAPETAAGVVKSRKPIRVRERGSLLLVSLLGLGVAAYGGFRWWQHARTWVGTDNAYVAAHIHQVSARVTGTIASVLVRENESVAEGAVLARLDRRDFEVRLQQARARAQQARAQQAQAAAKTAQAQAEVTRQQAQARKASQDLERVQQLATSSTRVVSRQELDAALAEAEVAEGAFKAAEAALAGARAAANAADAETLAAEAAGEDAQLQLSYTDILAPAGGSIGRKNLEVGNRVLPGQPLLALVQPQVWLVANFKETQLGRLRPGQEAAIELDAFPGRVLRGIVESLSPASGAQFALLPPDNATGNFTRIVQRVPVKILFEEGCLAQADLRVVPGMSAKVRIKVR